MTQSGHTYQQIRNGKYKEFNKRGVLISEGSYVNDLKHGVWKEYYDHTGSLMIEEHFVYGVKDGRFASYYPSGQVLSEGNFKNGKREGCFRVYDENGKHIRTLVFKNDDQIENKEEFEQSGATTYREAH